MTNKIEFLKSGEWVMRITADRRIEVNEGITVTEAAQKVLEALQTLLEQPEQKPLTEEEAHALIMQDYCIEEYYGSAMELIRRVEQAHGIGEKP